MIIALEEHYFDPDWNNVLDTSHHSVRTPSPLVKRMEDLGVQRIREMDEAGIDLQVLSHGPPGSQGVREDVVVAWTKAANDRLHAAVQNHPTRFAGFASLPTAVRRRPRTSLNVRSTSWDSRAACCIASRKARSWTTSATGRSSNARRRSTSPSTFTPRIRIRR